MRFIAGALLTAACFAGPVSTNVAAQVLDQAPVARETFNVPYETLAACSYERLDRAEGSGIKKVDLPTNRTVRLALESGGVRYWELVFRGEGKQQTSVEMTVVRTIWGPDTVTARRVMPTVVACGRP